MPNSRIGGSDGPLFLPKHNVGGALTGSRPDPTVRPSRPEEPLPTVDQSVTLAGMTMKNPVVVASGTFGFGREYGQFYNLAELGGICAKGLTLYPREGNPAPRIAETPQGILNSVGLQNPGVDAFVEMELPFLRQYDVKIIANISGNTPEEYGILCEKLSSAGVDMIEVNISCPNVKAGGLAYGTRPELAAEVTQVAKAHAGNVPVMVKLSPNVTDITQIAKAVADAGADALSLINTIRGMRIDINTRRPVLKMNTGGLSGPAVLPVAVRMVWEVAQTVSLPILGMGGVSKGEDAAQLMLAGASAVAVGTALFSDPYAPLHVRDGLARIAARQGLTRVRELTGAIRPW
ncbi:MAG: dihydroorotate dehydrogenase [Lawsonibacter sp.]|jgi:dihydroorotate dehydrogenase (NAD+) catalytic subunit